MQLKLVEVGIVKHKVTQTEGLDVEHTWVRLRLQGDLEPGDDSQAELQKLRAQLQEEALAWLELQPGYVPPAGQELEEVDVGVLEEFDAASNDIIPD